MNIFSFLNPHLFHTAQACLQAFLNWKSFVGWMGVLWKYSKLVLPCSVKRRIRYLVFQNLSLSSHLERNRGGQHRLTTLAVLILLDVISRLYKSTSWVHVKLLRLWLTVPPAPILFCLIVPNYLDNAQLN